MTYPTAWASVVLALTGPAVVAVLGERLGPSPPTLATHAIAVFAIVAIVFLVYASAILREGYSIKQLGFAHVSWTTLLLALALTAFFTLVFGPLASWGLARAGGEGFSTGLATVAQLPAPYLVMTIIMVASAEELLYRAYAIQRLTDLTGSYMVAGIVSVIAFGLAHVPMWGWAPSATAAVAGGIVTVVYVWRQDVLALILSHIATDLCGIVLAPHLARAASS